MGLEDHWPQEAEHDLASAVEQQERFYSRALTPAVTFSGRPLWRVMINWGRQTPEAAAAIVAAAWSAREEGTWPLYHPPLPAIMHSAATWAAIVSAYSAADGTITLGDSSGAFDVGSGDLLQVGRYVLRAAAAGAPGPDRQRVVTMENFPAEIADLSAGERDALTLSHGGDPATHPLTITASILGGQPPTVRRRGQVATLSPIVIVEVE